MAGLISYISREGEHISALEYVDDEGFHFESTAVAAVPTTPRLRSLLSQTLQKGDGADNEDAVSPERLFVVVVVAFFIVCVGFDAASLNSWRRRRQ